MKKLSLVLPAVISVLFSCTKEPEVPSAGNTGTIIHACLPDTRTALGARQENAWPNFWKAGDQISVNGVASAPLDEQYDGKKSADFTLEGVEAPYCSAYPSSAVSGYSEGTANVTISAQQTLVCGTYDPDAFVMVGKSQTDMVVLSPVVSIIHLSLKGEGSIYSVTISGEDDAVLAGTFATDFTSLGEASSPVNYVELASNEGIALPADIFAVVSPGTCGNLTFRINDTEGGSMTRKASLGKALAAGTVYSAPALTYNGTVSIVPEVGDITSSTAVVAWDNAPTASYTVAVYNDEACSDVFASYTIPAGDACWSGKNPRFCISGLKASTRYWTRVTNVTKGVTGGAVSFTTGEFTNVQVSAEPAEEGSVLLAEDFGELRWDCDMIGSGSGLFPTDQTSFANDTPLQFQAAATSNEKVLSFQQEALASSRLKDWAQGANRNLYIHPGYVKLVGSKKVTHIVTPELVNIPEGMVATIDVEVTASAYYSESSGSFCTDKAVVAVQTGDIKSMIGDNANTLDLKSNAAGITLRKVSGWNKYKVTLNGVGNGDRIAFGAADGVTGNDARMNLSDIRVTLVKLYDAGTVTAEGVEAGSSTAAFSWTHAGSASFDTSKPYTAALYNDSGCTSLVMSVDIPANAECWGGKVPCFVFAGLESGSDYYFRVKDTGDPLNPIVSNVVAARTADFTNVAYDEYSGTGKAGDVILAENFDEWGYGVDEVYGAAGILDNYKTLTRYSGQVDMNAVTLKPATDNGTRFFNMTKIWDTEARIREWGFAGNSSTYLKAGYIRATTTSSGNRTHIVSPKLMGIPEGKVATVEVSAKMLRTEADNDFGVLVQTGTMAEYHSTSNPETCYKLGTLASDNVCPFNMSSTGSWETHTVTIKNLTNANSLAFGSVEDIDTKNRFFVTDISVKITDLYDAPIKDLKAVCTNSTSSTLVFSWTEGISVKDDIADAYTVTLYKDSGCTEADQTFDIPAGSGAWNNKIPKFVFGGLNPSTSYWFKVKDTTNGLESNAVRASTDDFTIVGMPSSITKTGVVLSEDFGEICWDFDYPAGAVGFRPKSTSDFSLKDVKTQENNAANKIYAGYHASGAGGEMTFKGQGTALSNSARLNGWVQDSNVYIHPGHLKLGTSSAKGWILTPEFTVPEGKKAVVTVTVTGGRYNSSQESLWAIGVLTPSEANATPSSHSADFSWPENLVSTNYQEVTFTNNASWASKSVSSLEVHHSDRIVFGPRSGADSQKSRCLLSDITVEVTEIVDE